MNKSKYFNSFDKEHKLEISNFFLLPTLPGLNNEGWYFIFTQHDNIIFDYIQTYKENIIIQSKYSGLKYQPEL